MTLDNFEQIEEVLRAYVPLVSSYGYDGMSLERMWPLLKLAGNPHKKLKAIHISGTSGKTSTAYFIAAQLRSTGKKVGLTVSPHVDSIAERIQINGQPLDEKVFASELSIFLDLVENSKIVPSYFELLVVFIYWEFVRKNVDYAVIETGMGGLLDGTNVITRADKVCVITDIGFDHMHVLGKTLSEIATQKAGIIHAQNEVFMFEQSSEIMEPILNSVRDKHAKLNMLSDNVDISLSNTDVADLPLFQQRNWLLAHKVSEFVCKRDKLTLTKVNPSSLIVPGRMEKLVCGDGSVLLMDGAHNEQKVGVFIKSYKYVFPNQKATVMLALKKGKDYPPVIDKLSEIADSVIITTFNTSQDLPSVSQDPEKLRKYCQSIGLDAVIYSDNKEAINQLLNTKSKIKLIIGSFYLLGQIRHFL